MKQIAWFLLLFHLIILIFWVANSEYLFTLWGVIIWIASIVLGFVAYKKMKETDIVKKLIMTSSYFMVFLVIVTIAIFFTTNSMP
ncbi:MULTISPECIES: hypothetical protein [unclassified Peribacillus]|uniref:hypothetical protein n=1 Tax=unclassified Peribacillus TaxID=2675266 RepID=UPI001F4E4D51|nr:MULTISPECIES: hypothetical protein [unclassified Peribacillus]MCK1986079.1 hypothetical protein [Peribacillus sp. Aquil_B1]MCK2011425.1 hypothetical protein [Peribacillus sp. Aquil_B8]